MTVSLVNGTKFGLSTTRAVAAAVISALTNAAEAVATTAAPPAAGDIVVLESSWGDLDNRPVRAKSPTANSFVMEGVNTTDTARYPTGEGAGSTFRTYGTFIAIDQVVGLEKTGGEQQFYNYQHVDDPSRQQRQIPTSKNTSTLQITMHYDPAKPWYQALINADRLGEPVVLREVLPNGRGTFLHFGYISFDKDPTRTPNEGQQVTATLSRISEPVRY